MISLTVPHTCLLFLPQSFSEVFPHLVTATNAPKLCKIEDVNYGDVDAIFCCLPHATTQVRMCCRVFSRGHLFVNKQSF